MSMEEPFLTILLAQHLGLPSDTEGLLRVILRPRCAPQLLPALALAVLGQRLPDPAV